MSYVKLHIYLLKQRSYLYSSQRAGCATPTLCAITNSVQLVCWYDRMTFWVVQDQHFCTSEKTVCDFLLVRRMKTASDNVLRELNSLESS